MLIAVASAVLLTMAISTIFVERYYVHDKKRTLQEIYEYISENLDIDNTDSVDSSELSETNVFPDEFIMRLDMLSIQQNVEIAVSTKTLGTYITRIEGNNKDYFGRRLHDFYFKDQTAKGIAHSEVLYEDEEYTIIRSTDIKSAFRNIELISADFENERYIIVRSNLENIKETSHLTGRVLIFAGILMTVTGGIFMFLYSKRVSEPIKELSTIAGKMADLDFDVKYRNDSNDEIGELGRSINELSTKLEQNISELKKANISLQDDIEQKTKLEETRTEFLSNVSHELKTPIALIMGYAEGLKDGITDDPKEMQYYLDVIIDEASKMNQMVKKLLTLNSLENSVEAIDFSCFNICPLIESIIQNNELSIRKKNAKVSFIKDENANILADEFMTEEVVTNFLTNAVHYVNEGGEIKINLSDIGNRFRLSVFNSGSNIPEDALDRVWEKFYKVDKARTREYGGSGIGLSIVKAIAQRHHTECGARNEDNGVVFWFDFDKIS